eukprot:TRINITY_DN8678_c0_g1_i13.p2 TRINITY_DN8678_c0_g1~~TRINITY_DN8678_c0_g1_i13.p2  ORF type:complete len:172 (+),score=13.88 TRINITY_DN8678_c0_g1_i13:127-642(+)
MLRSLVGSEMCIRDRDNNLSYIQVQVTKINSYFDISQCLCFFFNQIFRYLINCQDFEYYQVFKMSVQNYLSTNTLDEDSMKKASACLLSTQAQDLKKQGRSAKKAVRLSRERMPAPPEGGALPRLRRKLGFIKKQLAKALFLESSSVLRRLFHSSPIQNSESFFTLYQLVC